MSADKSTIYFLCIIDFLTSFNWFRKKVEYAVKTTFVDKDVSCVPAAQYADRFRSFMLANIDKVERAPVQETNIYMQAPLSVHPNAQNNIGYPQTNPLLRPIGLNPLGNLQGGLYMQRVPSEHFQ
jgi:hypothetical protein